MGDDKVDSRIRDKMTGLSAGEEGNNNGLWISGSWTDLENDLSSTAYDGDSWLVIAGYDRMLTDRFLFGIAVGYDQADLDTTFNTGTLESDGITISPYAAYLFTDSLSMDLLVSFSDVGYDTSRTNRTITGSYDAERIMFSSSLTYYYFMDKWNLSGKVGYMYSSEEADSFAESDGTEIGSRTTNLGEIRVGGRVGYYYNNWEPYFSAYYLYDSTLEEVRVAAGQAQPDNDKDEIEASLGINYVHSEDMRLSLELINSFLREDIDNTSVMLNFRWEF
jgi:outer membrane autotransporter protein